MDSHTNAETMSYPSFVRTTGRYGDSGEAHRGSRVRLEVSGLLSQIQSRGLGSGWRAFEDVDRCLVGIGRQQSLRSINTNGWKANGQACQQRDRVDLRQNVVESLSRVSLFQGSLQRAHVVAG